MISLDISDELKEKLKQEASDKDMSLSALVRVIIKKYFEESEKWKKA